MLASGHRASAVRRFPPGCGGDHRAAHPAEHPGSSTTTNLATKAPKLARQPLLAVAFPRIEGPDRGEGNGSVAGIEVPAAEVVLVRSASAMRRYPPGCGRGAAVSKAGAPGGEGGAKPSKDQSASCNGEAKAIAGDQKVAVDADCNGRMNCGGDAGGAQEEGGGRPWDLTGLMSPPFLPWAQHGRRSRRQKLL